MAALIVYSVLNGGRMNVPLKIISTAFAAMFVLAGCQSTSDTQQGFDAESYEYKGAADPLMSIPASDRAGELGDRFDLIQGRK